MYTVLAFALIYISVIRNLHSVILTRENVIFQELDVISTTSSNWKITFVSDILPFQAITNQLYKSLDDVLLTTATIMHQYHTVKSTVRRKSFLNTCTAVSETMTK